MVQPSFCCMSHTWIAVFLGLLEISVLLQSARLLSKPTQARDKTLFIYAYTACASLITMHEHVGLSPCGIHVYMVAGSANTAQCTSLVATHQAQAETTY